MDVSRTLEPKTVNTKRTFFIVLGWQKYRLPESPVLFAMKQKNSLKSQVTYFYTYFI